MNGIDYLLDTNFIIGLLQTNPSALAIGADLITFDKQLQLLVAKEKTLASTPTFR